MEVKLDNTSSKNILSLNSLHFIQRIRCLFIVVVNCLASSSDLFPDCLKVKLVRSLPLFVAFYVKQGELGAYSS